MKIIRFNEVSYQASSHESQTNPGVVKKILLRKDDLVHGRVQMINWAVLKKGRSFEPHYHEAMEEVFIMVSGHVKIRIQNEESELRDGDTVLIPEKMVHQMWNLGPEEAHYLAIGISRGVGGKTIVVPKMKQDH